MFSISFNSDPERQAPVCRGTIQIGDFVELFESSLEHWSQADYHSQWLRGIERAAVLGKDSCLITSLTDPPSSNFLIWWPIYVDGDHAVFQNHVLFLDDIRSSFDVGDPHLSLRPRATVSEEGHPISEWMIPMQELENWLRLQKAL